MRQRPAAARASAAAALLALGALLAGVLAGCGGGGSGHHGSGGATASDTVVVYGSLPGSGPHMAQAAAVGNGIQLALIGAHDKAGDFTVHYIPRNDASGPHGWDPSATLTNARTAADNPLTVAYIGEFDSEPNELSIPVLNEAGILQISPTATLDALTQPGQYDRAGKQTFFRLVARDGYESRALLTAAQGVGCTKLAVVADKSIYGQELARNMVRLEPTAPLGLYTNPVGSDENAYAHRLKTDGVNCFTYAGTQGHGAPALIAAVAHEIPNVHVILPDRLCRTRALRAFDAEPAGTLHCLLPVIGRAVYPYWTAFRERYLARYPDQDISYALYGYEAMKLVLDTVAKLGSRGDDRAAVLAAVRTMKPRRSMLGIYRFQADGDTTLQQFGLYRVSARDRLTYEGAVG